MGLLKPATNETAFLKAGILGFEGSGKTFTAMTLAIGLTQLMQKKLDKEFKIAFFDTETGSDFQIRRANEAGISMDSVKSRSFADLIEFLKEVRNGPYSVGVIDSVSHVWKDVLEGYMERKRKSYITMDGWGEIKKTWAQFSDAFVNDSSHIILCGRAGNTYDITKDEDTGKKEIEKSGTKMKVEGEMAYEPSLLIEMEKFHRSKVPMLNGKINWEKGKVNRDAKGWVNRATILKDRNDVMNGWVIDNPTFKSFDPVVQLLNIGGVHVGFKQTGDTSKMFASPERRWEEVNKQRDIALEELKEVLILHGLDGTSTKAKVERTKLMIEVFGTSSWTAIESQTVETIRNAIDTMKQKFEKPAEPLKEVKA